MSSEPAPPGPLASLGCGLAMGTADAVPGVSGGTIALILGVYERLLLWLDRLLRCLRAPWYGARWRALRPAVGFLPPLALGIVVAWYLATLLLVGSYHVPARAVAGGAEAVRAHLLAQPPPGLLLADISAPAVYGFFFGLVLWSIGVPWRRRATAALADPALALLGALLAGTVALLPSAGGQPAGWYLALGGALAISAMLLPGISGSLVLLVLGLYQPVSAAAHERQLGVLAWVVLGIVIGAAGCIPLLRWLLRRHHDRTMALLAGLMTGSLVALWPWKTHYIPELIPQLGPMTPQAPSGAWWWPVCTAVAGMLVILLGERLSGDETRPCPHGG